MSRRNTYTVKQINSYIKNMFTQDFLLREIRIEGEVADCKYHQSGHIYFTLKDKEAAISAVMYRGSRGGLSFEMKNGDQIAADGQVDVYIKRGSYQFVARKIERQGEGDIYLRLEALKRRLEEMGMFDPMYKKPIPAFATRIGVVTAPGGAAIRDIQSTAFQRNPHVQIILYPAQVEGEGAEASIISGIRALDALGLDVIIVGRGGGSEGNLWAFNNEQVARAIFDCQTPVISAVGHEINWSVADLVADYRVNTPTGAAEKAVFDYRQAVELLRQMQRRMAAPVEQKLTYGSKHIQFLEARLQVFCPDNRLRQNKERLQQAGNALSAAIRRILQEKTHQFHLLAERIEACSPAKKLAQGFSYVALEDGTALHSVEQVTPGEHIEIHVTDGSLRAVVERTQKEERNG